MSAMSPGSTTRATASKKRKGKKLNHGPKISAKLPSVIETHDLGMRFVRGDVRMDAMATEPEDPNRKISRPMAVSAVDRLYDRGSISRAEHLAALKYQELREVEIGARWVGGESVGRLAPWQKGHPAMTQVQASTTLRLAHKAIGGRARVLVELLVIENLNATALAVRFGPPRQNGQMRKPEDDRVVRGWIQAALNRLAEEFGLLED